MRRLATLTAVLSVVSALVAVTPAVLGFPLESGGSSAATELPDQALNRLPENDHARGLVFDGLRPANPLGPCAGGFDMSVNGTTLCTPGPDRGPDGVDVRRGRSIPSSSAESDTQVGEGDVAATNLAEAAFPVVGDGVSGNRVLAVYAVAEDRPDRYTDVAPLISQWAADVDAAMNQSAAFTGGERHVRYVTDASGALVVEHVVLPADADDSFGATISALKAAGYSDPSRKYLIWTDANLYCGIATIYSDDKPTQDNYNNGRFAQYARVDSGCWGMSNSVELHELTHTLGAIQQSAPHSTPGWHCTDENDRMCYQDSVEVEMTYVCDYSMEGYLDCGHDDYFHTSPPAGSYLATHWNVANSSFLHAGPLDEPPPPPPSGNEAPVVAATAPSSVTLPASADLDGTVSDDGLPGPYTAAWSLVSGPASVAFADAAAVDTTVTFSVAGTYVLRLVADDGELSGSASVTIAVAEEPPPPPPPTPDPEPVTEIFESSLNKKFAARTFETTIGEGPALGVVEFATRGKKEASLELTVNIYDETGELVATVSGPTGTELEIDLEAGLYVWEVTGDKVSFALSVTYLAP